MQALCKDKGMYDEYDANNPLPVKIIDATRFPNPNDPDGARQLDAQAVLLIIFIIFIVAGVFFE
jgi:hypothetical protein